MHLDGYNVVKHALCDTACKSEKSFADSWNVAIVEGQRRCVSATSPWQQPSVYIWDVAGT